MSDAQADIGERAHDAESDVNRDAKIEQLLLAGLDHYFAGRYDQAIDVWSRAFFFDRTHPRARAYIERARSALAERQRELEELLQQGVAAFDRGEAAEARRLLTAAIDRGAPAEEALAGSIARRGVGVGVSVSPKRVVTDLPLFGSRVDDGEPLITKASPPRPPLAVRRATPEVPRVRAEQPRMQLFDLSLDADEKP